MRLVKLTLGVSGVNAMHRQRWRAFHVLKLAIARGSRGLGGLE